MENGVIVSGLQIVEAGVGVVVVAAVAQGVELSDSNSTGIGRGAELAPCGVGVFCNDRSAGVHQAYYITLNVQEIVVGDGLCCAVGVDQGIGIAGSVIDEVKNDVIPSAVCDRLTHNFTILRNIIMG